MAGLRSVRARDRASDLLATVYPIPDDAEVRRLRELAIDYIQEAERLEAENRGRAAESEELISAALDAVARDYLNVPYSGPCRAGFVKASLPPARQRQAGPRSEAPAKSSELPVAIQPPWSRPRPSYRPCR